MSTRKALGTMECFGLQYSELGNVSNLVCNFYIPVYEFRRQFKRVIVKRAKVTQFISLFSFLGCSVRNLLVLYKLCLRLYFICTTVNANIILLINYHRVTYIFT
jgi:hypothetical protein